MVTKFKKFRKGVQQPGIFLKLFCCVILAGIGFLVITNLNLNENRTKLDSQLKYFEQEMQDLEKENQELKARVSQLSEEEYIETILREKEMYKKTGEGVIVVTKEELSESDSSADTSKQALTAKDGFTKKTSATDLKCFAALRQKIADFFRIIF